MGKRKKIVLNPKLGSAGISSIWWWGRDRVTDNLKQPAYLLPREIW